MKIKILLLLPILFLTACSAEGKTKMLDGTENLETYKEYGNTLLTFSLFSDIHFHNVNDATVKQTYPLALLEARRLTGDRIDAVVVTGDFSEGYIEDYDTLINTTKTYSKENTPLIASYGNHEGNNKQNQYVDKFGVEKNNVRTVNGFSFISLTPYNSSGNSDFYTMDQPDYLDEQLSNITADGNKKPVFTLVHHPIQGATNAVEAGTYKLKPILDQYSNAFVLSGHDHSPFSDKSLYKGKFYAFETAAMTDKTTSYFAIVRYTDKGYIIIEKYTVTLGNNKAHHLESDIVINFNEFIDSFK